MGITRRIHVNMGRFPFVRSPLQCLACGLLAFFGPTGARPPKQPRTELSHRCSRVLSRNVRKQLEKEVLGPSMRAGIKAWPPNCPFDPALDLYGKHENEKQRKRGSTSLWTCGICKKQFKSEHYLDLHFERKHMNETPRNGVCLADYCEMFEICGWGFNYRRPSRNEPIECNDSALAIRRSQCNAAMKKCFPLNDEVSRQMHAKLSRQYCQVIDCMIREEQRKAQHSEHVPVVVLLILIVLICFIVFSITIFCVDYSDDIFTFLVESHIASFQCVRRMRKVREKTRVAVGLDRTRQI